MRDFLQAEARVDSTHPPAAQRIAAIAEGWDTCHRLWRTR